MNDVDLSFLNLAPYPEKLRKWEEFQKRVKIQRKKLAKKYHPDVGGDQRKMQEINRIVDLVLNVKPAPPRPAVNVVKITVYDSSWTSYWGPEFSSTATSYY